MSYGARVPSENWKTRHLTYKAVYDPTDTILWPFSYSTVNALTASSEGVQFWSTYGFPVSTVKSWSRSPGRWRLSGLSESGGGGQTVDSSSIDPSPIPPVVEIFLSSSGSGDLLSSSLIFFSIRYSSLGFCITCGCSTADLLSSALISSDLISSFEGFASGVALKTGDGYARVSGCSSTFVTIVESDGVGLLKLWIGAWLWTGSALISSKETLFGPWLKTL